MNWKTIAEGRLSCRPLGAAAFLPPPGTGDFLVACSPTEEKEEDGTSNPPDPPGTGDWKSPPQFLYREVIEPDIELEC